MAHFDVATAVPAEDQTLSHSTDDEVTTSSDRSVTQFTMFKKLPTELRFKIWHAAHPSPRTIILHKVRRTRKEDHQKLGPDAVATDPSKVPALLHTNQEARHETLKYYQICFKDEMNGPQVYFDYERDILVFRDHSALSAFYGHNHGPGVSLDKHECGFALGLSDTELESRLHFIAVGCHLSTFLTDVLCRFRQLEKITFQNSLLQASQSNSTALELISRLSADCLHAANRRGQTEYTIPEIEVIAWHQFALRFPVVPRPSVDYVVRSAPAHQNFGTESEMSIPFDEEILDDGLAELEWDDQDW